MPNRPLQLIAAAVACLALLVAATAAAGARTARARRTAACHAHRGHACPTRAHARHTRRAGAGARRRRSSATHHRRSAPQAPSQPQQLRPRRVAGFNRVRPARSVVQALAGASANDVAATIAQALAAPCQNTEATPEEGNLEAVKAAVLCLINRERAQNGVPPLRPDAQLEAAATAHARELVSADYFAHVSPSGETPVERIRLTGYIPNAQVGYVIGENLAWGTYSLATPQAIVNAWIASPEHLANILEAHYTETGISVTPAVPPSLGGGSPGATYAEEFGVILH